MTRLTYGMNTSNTPTQYTKILKAVKIVNLQTKNCDISFFCSKHRLWVLFKSASLMQYPQSMFISKNEKKKIMYTPVKSWVQGLLIIQAH